MIYLFTAFGILPGTGSYIVNLSMLFISVRIPKVFVQVLSRPIFSEHVSCLHQRISSHNTII
jgi:hypothetical protein